MEASGESVFERTVAGSELGAQPKEAQGGQKAWGEEDKVKYRVASTEMTDRFSWSGRDLKYDQAHKTFRSVPDFFFFLICLLYRNGIRSLIFKFAFFS